MTSGLRFLRMMVFSNGQMASQKLWLEIGGKVLRGLRSVA